MSTSVTASNSKVQPHHADEALRAAHPLNAVRGIAIGLLLSVPIWAGIVALVWALT